MTFPNRWDFVVLLGSLALVVVMVHVNGELSATDTVSFPVPQDSVTWNEVKWSSYLASNTRGIAEYRCPDGARIDVLTDSTAWEVEWSDKWKESIGQAVLYSIQTERAPGIWLLRKPGDDEHYLRCVAVVEHLRGKGLRIELRSQRTY